MMTEGMTACLRTARSNRAALTITALALLIACPAFAQTSQPAQAESATKQAAPEASAPAKEPPVDEFVAWPCPDAALRNEPKVPPYAKPLNQFGFPGAEKIDWFDFGMEHRTRFEHRDDDYRKPNLQENDVFLQRSRAYMGIEKIFDPIRFAVEFQDSRSFNDTFPLTTTEVDENDFAMAYGELFFKDGLGKNRPLAFQAGRMNFDYTDSHTLTRSRWANVSTSFDGFRLQFGEPKNDWQVDVFGAQPVERRLRRPDHGDDERWLYGVEGAWRRWQKYITLEPYYLILDEDRKNYATPDRTVHTLGLRGFGPIGKTGFDYDVDTMFQTGNDGHRQVRAFAATSDVCYTFQHNWKPRLSVVTLYASGDQDPDDKLNERVIRLFDSTFPYCPDGYFTLQNVISPRLRLEARPTEKLRMETSYAVYWLASGNDSWGTIGRVDGTGHSGDFVGQQADVRVRYQVNSHLEFDIGYSHFMTGTFVRNTGDSNESDYLWVATTIRL